MTPRPIYLDHHATTPVDRRVADVVYAVMTERFGNANSVDHRYGEDAAAILDVARGEVAALVGASAPDVRFTSGSTEAIRLALAYAAEAAGGSVRVAVSPIEHEAVLDAVEVARRESWADAMWLSVEPSGRVPLASVAGALEAGADLICLMAANNEIGTLQEICGAAVLTQGAGARLLVDATQAAGRVPLQVDAWGVDYMAISAHKMYGPKGVGALIGADLGEAPLPGRFAGHAATPNTPAIAGLGEACRLRRLEMGQDEPRIAALRNRLQARLVDAIPGLAVNGDPAGRLSNNLHVSVPGAPNDLVVLELRDRVAISTGAACASGADAPSHVLRALGLPPWRLEGALRISLGTTTTEYEIERAGTAIIEAIRATQALAEDH